MTIGVGTLLGGRYRLTAPIASGGMGQVWRGEDTVLGRIVAVKVMHRQLSTDPGFLSRFRNEARHTAALSHPGIATVYDYGEADAAGGGHSEDADQAYLVMELVDGEPLSDLLERAGALDPGRTMDLVGQTAAALHAAHQAGVVHRDVKPGNVLVRPDGQVVITDFGIARTVDAAAAALTQTGTVLGTAAYISPEQAEGKPATPVSDVYSLGVVAYQCVAGRRPFEGDNPLTVAIAHLREPPPPLSWNVPPAVAAVIERAMAKDPRDRFGSAAEMASAARQAAVRPGDETLATQVLGAGPQGAAGLGAAGAAGLDAAGLGAAGAAAAVGATTRPLQGRVPPVPPPAYEEEVRYEREYDDDRQGYREPPRRSVWPTVLVVATLLALLAVGGIVYTALQTDPGGTGTAAPGATTSATGDPAPSSPAVEESSAAPSPTATSASATATASATPSRSPSPRPIVLDEGDYVGRPYQQVRAELLAKGLRVNRETVDDGDGEPGDVVGIRTGERELERGDSVTLLVLAAESPSPTPSATPSASASTPSESPTSAAP